jgi:hypothetical protein
MGPFSVQGARSANFGVADFRRDRRLPLGRALPAQAWDETSRRMRAYPHVGPRAARIPSVRLRLPSLQNYCHRQPHRLLTMNPSDATETAKARCRPAAGNGFCFHSPWPDSSHDPVIRLCPPPAIHPGSIPAVFFATHATPNSEHLGRICP